MTDEEIQVFMLACDDIGQKLAKSGYTPMQVWRFFMVEADRVSDNLMEKIYPEAVIRRE